MAGVFDLLDSMSFRDLLMGAAAVPSINTLLTSKSPGTTPASVDQYIAQSQQGLGDLRGYINQFQSPEALARRQSGAQSEIAKKRALAESGLGVKGSYDAAKMGAENNFKQAQRLIAQSFNRRGIRPGSNLAIEPMEQAGVDYSFRVAQLDAERDKELRAEQERIAELGRAESEVPEADFTKWIQPLLLAQLQAANPSTGAALAQSGRNSEILGSSMEKQAAAGTLGQLAMLMALTGKGSTGGMGGMNTSDLAAAAKTLGIPLAALQNAIGNADVSNDASRLLDEYGNTEQMNFDDMDVDSGGGGFDAGTAMSGAGLGLSAAKMLTAGSAPSAMTAAAPAAAYAAAPAAEAAGAGIAGTELGSSVLGSSLAAPLAAASVYAVPSIARAAAPYVQSALDSINPSRVFGGSSRPTAQEAGDANVARISSEYAQVNELLGGDIPMTLEDVIQQTGGNPFEANALLRNLVQQNRWRVDALHPDAFRWGIGGDA